MSLQITLVTLLVALAGTCTVYQRRHAAQLVERDAVRIVAARSRDAADAARLRAEWVVLSGPDRLADLGRPRLASRAGEPPALALVEATTEAEHRTTRH